MPHNLNRVGTAIAVSVLFATAGFVAWRVVFPPHVAHFAIVVDRSASPAFPVCDAAASIALNQLALPNTVKESQVTLIATGDARNGFQGRFVQRWSLPKKLAAFRTPKKQTTREQAYINEVAESCHGLDKANRSPILYAISAAVIDLRALGCRQRAGCRVDVASDGDENVDPVVAAALQGDERGTQKRPPVIDNTGIEIVICGISQAPRSSAVKTTSDDGDRIGRARRIWSTVFSSPDLVSAKPFCRDSTVAAPPTS